METNKHRTGLGRDFLLLWQGYAFSAAGNLLLQHRHRHLGV